MMSVLNLVAFVTFATSLFTRSTDPIIAEVASAFTVEPATAALLATAFAIPYAVVQPLLGALADMFSKTRLMTICLLALVAASIAAAFANSFEMLMATRAVSGIAAGGIFPIALAIVGDRVPVAQRQVAIGRVLAAAMLGTLLGASGSGIIADLFGWRSVFVATAILGFLILVAAYHGFRGLTDTSPGKFDVSIMLENYRAIFGNPLAKYCFGAVFFEAMFVFGLFPHVASLLQAAGEGRASIAGIVLSGFGLGAILYTLSVSRLLARFSGRALMITGGVTIGLCLGAVTLRMPWPFEFATFLVLGFGMYLLHGYIQVVVTELAPAARGSAMALHAAAFFFGQGVGPIVYGAGFATFGVTATMLTGAAVLIAAGIISGVVLGRATQAKP